MNKCERDLLDLALLDFQYDLLRYYTSHIQIACIILQMVLIGLQIILKLIFKNNASNYLLPPIMIITCIVMIISSVNKDTHKLGDKKRNEIIKNIKNGD